MKPQPAEIAGGCESRCGLFPRADANFRKPSGEAGPEDERYMPDVISDLDIKRVLASAFDRAWERYYRSGRLTISRNVARSELARRLVQLSKDGVRDEEKLAKAGLSHLRQLTFKGGKAER